jgi:hypothetical protein
VPTPNPLGRWQNCCGSLGVMSDVNLRRRAGTSEGD